jgi:predicted DNA-binding transcriptional regulator
MVDDRVTGGAILVVSLGGIVAYCWLLFMSPWAWLTVQVSAFLAVGMMLLIMAWIGYTLATTPPPMPLEDFDFGAEVGGSAEESGESEESEKSETG